MYINYQDYIQPLVNHLLSNTLPKFDLFLRIAKIDDSIYYDLTDDKWRVIQITKGKYWKILEGQDVPILFHRDAERHSRGQIEPVKYYPSDVMDKFIDVTNISNDGRTKLLFKSHLISLFIPTIAHPIFLFAGPKGSAKTQLQRFIKNIVDPDNLEITAIPKDEKDFVLEASKSRLLSYDNVSYLERWFSDRACSAITGTSSAQRKLYTDNEEINFQYKNSILINTVNKSIFKKEDFLDRTIIYDMSIIKYYKKEELQIKEFNNLLPQLLSYIFDIVAKAMKIADDMNSDSNVESLPRMADFAFWGEAIARAMGYQSNQFLRVYKEHLTNRFDNDATNKTKSFDLALLELITNFVISKGGWEGLTTNCLNELKFYAKADNKKGVKLPRNAGALVRKIGLLKDALKNKGIEYTISRNEQNYSYIIFYII